MEKKLLPFTCFMGFIIMILIYWYTQSIPLNGITIKTISESIGSLFTPPSYVFSIWFLIDGLLLGFIICQFIASNRLYNKIITLPFMISCLLNSIYIVLFHYFLFVWSLFFLICLMLYLTFIYIVLNKFKKGFNTCEELFVYIPFSIYFAWITITVLSNVSIVFLVSGSEGFGLSPVLWTIVMIMIGTCLALTIANKFKDPYFLMVYLWAYLGLVLKYIGSIYISLLIVALVSCLLFIINLAYILQHSKWEC